MPELDTYIASTASHRENLPDGPTVYISNAIPNENTNGICFVANLVFDGVEVSDVRKACVTKFEQYKIDAKLSKETKSITESTFENMISQSSNSYVRQIRNQYGTGSASNADENPEPPVLAKEQPDDLDALLRDAKSKYDAEIKLNESLLPRGHENESFDAGMSLG